jgi:hypothetical protein
MMLQLDLWDFIKTLGAAVGVLITAFWVLGVLLARRFEQGQNERFKGLKATIDEHIAEERKIGDRLTNLERDFLVWKAELPEKYVIRDDYIRGQVTMEAKQDALYEATKGVQMQLQYLVGQMEGNKK